MKYASLSLSVLAFCALSLCAACSSESPAGARDAGSRVTQDARPPDATVRPPDAPVQVDAPPLPPDAPPDAPQMCMARCTQDSDCQAACAPVSTGSNCCDTTTGVCYVASASICPPPALDSGMLPQ